VAAEELAKRACQRCEYLNPRQALYCLRCGEIFRPVLAETPWEYLRPEREQRRALVLGKAALEQIGRLTAGPAWHRIALSSSVLVIGFALLFGIHLRRVLSRELAGEPGAVTRAIWTRHHPVVERQARPLIRPKPALKTLADPFVFTWCCTAGPIALYLTLLSLIGLARRELYPPKFIGFLDPFFPMASIWADLISGRRRTRRAALAGAPAVLVAAAYGLWGLATFAVVPGAVYYGELRLEGLERGLKGLGLEPPPDSRIAPQGLWADRDGTIRVLIESGLDSWKAVDHYRGWISAGDQFRLTAGDLRVVRKDGSHFNAVALDASDAQQNRGVHSVLYLSLTPPTRP
jgi:hypothetical protein